MGSESSKSALNCHGQPNHFPPMISNSSNIWTVRDRDRIYGQEFRKQVEVMNIKEVLSAPRSPWQRAYVERVIGSIRRECLDHVIVFDEESLRRTLRSYFCYYKHALQLPRPANIVEPALHSGPRVWHCVHLVEGIDHAG